MPIVLFLCFYISILSQRIVGGKLKMTALILTEFNTKQKAGLLSSWFISPEYFNSKIQLCSTFKKNFLGRRCRVSFVFKGRIEFDAVQLHKTRLLANQETQYATSSSCMEKNNLPKTILLFRPTWGWNYVLK